MNKHENMLKSLKNINKRNSDEYQTPPDFFKLLDDEFHFDLDPCTTIENNLKINHYFTKKYNGLLEDWNFYNFNNVNNVFVNPPYSEIGKWIEKGYNESLKGSNIIFLIMVDTSLSYWHDIIFSFAKQIRFINGRLNFYYNNYPTNNNFHASSIIIFSENLEYGKYKSDGFYYENKIVYYKKSINKYFKDKNKKDIKKEIKELLDE